MLYKVTKTATGTSNITLRIRINTSNTLTGSVQIAILNVANTATYSLMNRNFDLSGGNLYGLVFSGSSNSDITSASPNSTTYNTANTLYVFFTIQLVTSSDSCTFNMANITN